jgi:PPPDE putative peptidase domain
VGVGVFHSGIEIKEWEYSFASKGKGIFRILPRQARGVRFREQIEMGVLDDDDDEVEVLIARALDALRPRFLGTHYDLFNQNCNHFCDALLQELLGKSLPGHVNRMSKIWTTANIQWMVPRRIRQSAPTGDKDMKAYGGLVPFLESAAELSSLMVKEWIDSSQSITEVVSASQKLSVLMEEGVTS